MLIHLGFVPLRPLAGAERARLLTLLSHEELGKVGRFASLALKDKALLSRACLRLLLSQYGVLAPHQWCFDYGKYGKPGLSSAQRQATGLEFNLSHSGDWLMVAVLQTHGMQVQLGVDIEHERARTDIHPILRHYFSAAETTALLTLSADEQRGRFFDLWALKESYIKAQGMGLALALDSFSMDLSRPGLGELTLNTSIPGQSDTCLPLLSRIGLEAQEAGFDSGLWQCSLGRLDADYRFAVSLGGMASEVKLSARQWGAELFAAIEQ
ncbi:4'-phosphopantetheinyl transferase superfamily protein [Shewanella sp. AS16]|uniref:4'-phosphopantetheinyl transferase family protein n=1 Tax=Shewanella sp. AS16 TaxID=2907625 RepID=UPI001F36A85E|nr:4'-phosphopantetheinyl transferase superfamily protein [Shewanella sp. AS16]MCE9685125.1 4'-phosphopantetheinyl transferase superfamily protein [Shewanella sp. AS16]